LWPALANRWETYNRVIAQLEDLEKSGQVQVIRPDRVLPASRMTRDRGRIIETMDLGRGAAHSFLLRQGLAPAGAASGTLQSVANATRP
jgi:predicted patatin/cPLA2 family phospholipase